MNNKAVLAFLDKSEKSISYGKWRNKGDRLYFGHRVICGYVSNKLVSYDYDLSSCGFEYPTFHAIEKVLKFIRKD